MVVTSYLKIDSASPRRSKLFNFLVRDIIRIEYTAHRESGGLFLLVKNRRKDVWQKKD